MSAEASRAVFLSYASQDAEAARRLCEALRSGGVEVWFDADGGLEHGDEWDQKIRRQIKECVLFIPVISANTQAREEGYFRIEWELAAQRALGIASGVPFILPVVIDDTREPDALVPDRFRAVQWTRLRGGEVPSDVQQRFLKLWSHRAGVLKQQARTAQASDPAATSDAAAVRMPRHGSRRVPAVAWIAALVTLAAVTGFIALRPRTDAVSPPAPEKSSSIAAAKPVPTVAPLSEARQLLAKTPALMEALDNSRDDYKLAEDLIVQAKSKDPLDAEVWAAEAQLHEHYLGRGWDVSDARRESARAAAQRAIRLDPQSFEARLAQAGLLADTGRDGTEKERQLRELRAEHPKDKRVLRMLASVIDRLGRMDESAAIADESAALAGGDPLALYSKSLGFWFAGRTTEAETAIQASLAQQSFTGALLIAAWYRIALHGDLDGARGFIARIEPAQMIEDRAAFFGFYLEYLAHRPDAAIARLTAVPRDWLSDFWFRGPKGWLVGDALEMSGRHDAAVIEWKTALKLVEQRLVANPSDPSLIHNRICLLFSLGQREEAERQFALFLQMKSAVDIGSAGAIAKCHALLGHKAEALKTIAAGLKHKSHAVIFSSGVLRLDPVFDSLRGEPEFVNVVAEAEASERATGAVAMKSDLTTAAPAIVDEKSVAVLAFANLSDDKANEYFSDGISEELLNVLAKIPGLKVSARTSAFSFKGKNVPIPEIAQQLGVAYVVEGSVRKAGDKVRITAQLIKAAGGFHVWSETFTRELKDIFAVQDEIAGLIAGNLRTKMAVARERPAPAPEVYALVLQARHAAADQTNDGARRAIALYQQAVTRDPKCADAWAESALNYVQLGRFGGLPTSDGMREARLAARHALDLDPEHPLGLLALAWVQRTDDRDWRGAIDSFRRALAAAPENVTIMSDAAICFLNVGFIDEALALAERAAERDPLNPRAQWSHGAILLWSGQPARAAEIYRRAVALAPTGDEYHSHLSRALAMAGRYAEAMTEARLEPNERYRLVAIATAQYLSGDRPAGDRTLQEIIDKYGDTMAGYLANICAVAGKIDEAFRWFDRGFETRDAAMAWVKTNSAFRRLHDDPRWDQFLHKMGLADDQLK